MKLNHPLQTIVLAGLVAGGFATACSADIIYQDTFARGSTGPIVGSAPTTDNSGLGATWTAVTGGATGFVSTGTNCYVAETYWDTMMLPLDWTGTFKDPRAQMDVIFTSTGSGDWAELILGNCDYWSSAQAAILRVAADGHAWAMSGGQWGWDTNVDCGVVGNPGGWNRLQINYSNTLGTASFFVNGNPVVADVPINTYSTGVGLGYDAWASSTITNFLVSYGSDVTFPPSITAQPQGKTIFVGDPLSISMQASGTLPITYTWYKDGVALPDHNGNTLSISSAALSDSGDYKVVLHNGYGPDVESSTVRVDVHLEVQTPLAQINFDDLTNCLYVTGFPWWSAWEVIPPTEGLPTTWSVTPGIGVGGSTGFRTDCDTTAIPSTDLSWAGFASSIALTLPKLPTANLDFYACYFSARVENLGFEADLVTHKTNTPGRIDIRFYIADPADPTKEVVVASVEQHYTWNSNFQDFAFVLDRATCKPEERAALFANLANLHSRVQLEFSSDTIISDFAHDPGAANATIVVDNVKLALRQSPPISVTMDGGQAVIHWADPNVVLMGSVDVGGPYVAIPGAAAPSYTVPGASPYHFFRTAFTPVP